MSSAFEYTSSVRPEWIDHNGHMNVAYYVVAFDEATDAAYERWGIGLDYPGSSGCSVFTLGMNVDYRCELFSNDTVRIATDLVDCDEKRIHYFHRMYNDKSGDLAATNECLCMNVDLRSRKASPFPSSICAILEREVDREHQPEGLGRILQIRRR
ncbi:MAG: thioesterase family protein [Gammaproteobacteria bacterium]|nr:thioesterase family protein [Gammaproteobacteria bacterium]